MHLHLVHGVETSFIMSFTKRLIPAAALMAALFSFALLSKPAYAIKIENQIEQERQSGQISGVVYDDVNADGIKGPKELGLENWDVYLLSGNSPYIVAGIYTTASPFGGYTFQDIEFDTYFVCQEIQEGWQQTQLPASGSGLELNSLGIGDIVTDTGGLAASIAEFCYEVVLNIEISEVSDVDFGNHRDPVPQGSTLGVSTTKNASDSDGEVLGAKLPDTGTPFASQILFGITFISLTVCLAFATRTAYKQQN